MATLWFQLGVSKTGYNKGMISPLLPVLLTPRLILRPMTVGDSEAVTRMISVSRESFSRWFTWAREANLDSVREYSRRVEEAMAVGTTSQYVVLTRAYSLVGRVGLMEIDTAARCAELGYMLRTDFEGQGLMTEAAHKLASHAFGLGGLHRLSAYVDVENVGSQRVLSRLGFRHEGTLRHVVQHPERGWRDQHVYGLLEGELVG